MLKENGHDANCNSNIARLYSHPETLACCRRRSSAFLVFSRNQTGPWVIREKKSQKESWRSFSSFCRWQTCDVLNESAAVGNLSHPPAAENIQRGRRTRPQRTSRRWRRRRHFSLWIIDTSMLNAPQLPRNIKLWCGTTGSRKQTLTATKKH